MRITRLPTVKPYDQFDGFPDLECGLDLTSSFLKIDQKLTTEMIKTFSEQDYDIFRLYAISGTIKIYVVKL